MGVKDRKSMGENKKHKELENEKMRDGLWGCENLSLATKQDDSSVLFKQTSAKKMGLINALN